MRELNPKSKKICFVSDRFITDRNAVLTGVTVQSYLLARELVRSGWQVAYVTYGHATCGVVKEVVEGITVYRIPERNYFRWSQLLRFFAAFSRARADYYYQRGREVYTGFVALYTVLTGRTFLWASSGETGVTPWKYIRQVFLKRRNPIKKGVLIADALINDVLCHFGIRHADQIFAQTHTQRINLKRRFRVDSIILQSGHEMPKDGNRSFPLKILWIGSIKAVKRPEIFVDLARRCNGLASEFWLAGQDADKVLAEEIRRSMRALSNCRFLGPVAFEGSGNLIASAHVLVNTTQDRYEGLPNAFVQAWLGGTVTLTLHANPDAVITRQRLGYQCRDMDEMVSHLQRWIERPDEWRQLSDNCRRYGRSNFSIGSIAKQLEKAIESVVL